MKACAIFCLVFAKCNQSNFLWKAEIGSQCDQPNESQFDQSNVLWKEKDGPPPAKNMTKVEDGLDQRRISGKYSAPRNYSDAREEFGIPEGTTPIRNIRKAVKYAVVLVGGAALAYGAYKLYRHHASGGHSGGGDPIPEMATEEYLDFPTVSGLHTCDSPIITCNKVPVYRCSPLNGNSLLRPCTIRDGTCIPCRCSSTYGRYYGEARISYNSPYPRTRFAYRQCLCTEHRTFRDYAPFYNE